LSGTLVSDFFMDGWPGCWQGTTCSCPSGFQKKHTNDTKLSGSGTPTYIKNIETRPASSPLASKHVGSPLIYYTSGSLPTVRGDDTIKTRFAVGGHRFTTPCLASSVSRYPGPPTSATAGRQLFSPCGNRSQTLPSAHVY